MKLPSTVPLFVAVSLLVAVNLTVGQENLAASLPEGIKAVWDTGKAARESTPTREKICINGLWRWQPAAASAEQVPAGSWGYFKVPGCWPGITDYMQKDFQTVQAHPSWKGERLGNISAAWYERTFSMPKEWNGRRIALSVEYLNSFAAVFVNGTKRGEIRFPGGELDLTAHLSPGGTNVLSLLVLAMPLKGVMQSYTDSNSAREIKGKVERGMGRSIPILPMVKARAARQTGILIHRFTTTERCIAFWGGGDRLEACPTAASPLANFLLLVRWKAVQLARTTR